LRLEEGAPTPNEPPLHPGRLIDGRYRLIKVIARGGMGEVWLGYDANLQELVALKFPRPGLRSDASALAELRKETDRHRRLRHPHIVGVFDFHTSETDGAYLTMEYAQGTSLQRLRSERAGERFTWKFLHPLVFQLCQALQYAHGQQVIHRDIKPANLILGPRRVLKLVDFGVAEVVTKPAIRISLSIRRTGTLPYMSPQQLSGLTPRPTDDFYSLGATLYDLLSGQPPFFEGDIPRQIREAMPMPLRSRLRQRGVRQAVPVHIEALIMACLAKRPDCRPQSAGEISEWIRDDLRWRGIGSRLRRWVNRMAATPRGPGQP
jgi:serine/threonine protein kinase